MIFVCMIHGSLEEEVMTEVTGEVMNKVMEVKEITAELYCYIGHIQ